VSISERAAGRSRSPGSASGATDAERAAGLSPRTQEILAGRSAARIRHRGWLVRKALMWSDLVGLVTAFVIAEALFQPPAGSGLSRLGVDTEVVLFALTLPMWIVVARMYGLYNRDESHAERSTADDVVGVFHLVTIGAWLLLAGAWLTHLALPAFTKVLTFWALAILFVTCARVGARAICRTRPSYVQNAVMVGAGDVGQLIARKIQQHPEYGINLVGFLDDLPKERRADLEDLTILGSAHDLPEVIPALDIERVIVAFSNDSFEETVGLVRSLEDFEVQVDIVPRLFDLLSPRTEIHLLEGVPLLGLPPLRLSRSARLFKRTMDITLSAVGLVLLAPLFALLALLVKLDSSGPVLFTQPRMGRGDRTFRIYKFRTMVGDAEERKATIAHLNKHARPGGDARMFKVPNDPRVTRLGRFMRRYSLDELPQLLNVVIGDMSLVGPRPLILDEDTLVEDWGRRRLDLRPGITGLWQVLGRSEIPFSEMIKLDYTYVTTWSLWSDFRLLLRTIPLVFKGDSRTS
jgi:exopolysaccharide biosynthesis polyprenyl glycosylphosphotransferase